MIPQGRLFNLFNVFGNYKNLLTNRISASVYQLQNANLKSTTTEKLKSLKIPEHPKRPLTPYFRFMTEKRQQIQKQHPNFKLVEVAKQCAEDWKNVSENVKEKYYQDFNDEMKMYKLRRDEFKSSLTKEQQEALKAATKEKSDSRKRRAMKKRYVETQRPKRPIGSYLYFIKDKHALPQNKGKMLTEILANYKEEWKNMNSNQKEKYMQMYKADKERYNNEIAAWEARMIEEGNVDIIRKESRITTTTAKPLKLDNVKPKKVR